MAKSWSQASKYESKYGGGYVTPAQYLIECLCVLIARQNKIQLAHKFWDDPYWANIFKVQARPIKELLAVYPHPVILETLRDSRCWKLRSFGAKWLLLPILKQKLKIFNAQHYTEHTTLTTHRVDQPPRKPPGKHSLLKKLKDIDGRKDT